VTFWTILYADVLLSLLYWVCKPAYSVPVSSQDKLGGRRVAAGRASNVKMGDEGGGSLVSSDGMVPIRVVSVSASDISPCTIKSRRFLLTPAHPGGPRKRAVQRLCVCVCLC